MVSINSKIQQWTNLQVGERLVIENDTLVVKHRSKVTCWEWLTGRARLGHVLEHIITKVEKHQGELQASTAKDLSAKMEALTDKFYGAHWSIYTWLFGNDARCKCAALAEKLHKLATNAASLSSPTSEASDPVEVVPGPESIPEAADPVEVVPEPEGIPEVEFEDSSPSSQAQLLTFAANNSPVERTQVNVSFFVDSDDPHHFLEPFASASAEIKDQWIIYVCNNWGNGCVQSGLFSENLTKPWFLMGSMADLRLRPAGSDRKEALDAILALVNRSYADMYHLGGCLLDAGGMFFEEDVNVEYLVAFFRHVYRISGIEGFFQSDAQSILQEKKSQIIGNHDLVASLLDLNGLDPNLANIEYYHRINKEYIIPEILLGESRASMYLDTIFAQTPSSVLSDQEKIYWIFYANCGLDKKRELLTNLTLDPHSVIIELLKFSERDNFEELVHCVFDLVDFSSFNLNNCPASQYPALRHLVRVLDLSVDSQKAFFQKAASSLGRLVIMQELRAEQVNALGDVMNDSQKIWFRLIHDAQSVDFTDFDEHQSRAFWNARYPFLQGSHVSLCLRRVFLRKAAKEAINSVWDKQTIRVFLKSLLDTAKALPQDCLSSACDILSDFNPEQMAVLFPDEAEGYALAFTTHGINEKKQKDLESIVKIFGTEFLSEIEIDDFPESRRASVYQLSFTTTIEEANEAIAELCQ